MWRWCGIGGKGPGVEAGVEEGWLERGWWREVGASRLAHDCSQMQPRSGTMNEGLRPLDGSTITGVP